MPIIPFHALGPARVLHPRRPGVRMKIKLALLITNLVLVAALVHQHRAHKQALEKELADSTAMSDAYRDLDYKKSQQIHDLQDQVKAVEKKSARRVCPIPFREKLEEPGEYR